MDEFKDLRRKMQLPPSPSVRLEVGWGLITSGLRYWFFIEPNQRCLNCGAPARAMFCSSSCYLANEEKVERLHK